MRAASKGPHGRGPRVHQGAPPRPNAGQYRPGPDTRRHELTPTERRRGGVKRAAQLHREWEEALLASTVTHAELVAHYQAQAELKGQAASAAG